MHWSVDIETIRSLLGEELDLQDSDILTDAILIPVLEQVRMYCARALDTTSEEERKLVKVAVAHLVAATVMAMAPRMASSKLGDSTVTYVTGDVDQRADALERKAWSLLDAVCVTGYVTFPAFRLAPGGGRR